MRNDCISPKAKAKVFEFPEGGAARPKPEDLNHPSIQQIIVTDSIPVTHHHWPRVYVVSLAPLLTSAIRRDVSAAR